MMTQETSTTSDPTSGGRAVLLWRPDSDESDVRPGVEHVAQFLGVGPDAVLAAISSGELLAGWFVDWEVAETR
jgi:hypothetical protein